MSDWIDFEPMTEQEIKESNLLPEGRYRADVFDAFDKDSNGQFLMTQKGTRKFDTILNVYTEEGGIRRINCALTPAFMKLFKHFFDATRQEEAFNSKRINIDNVRGKKDFIVDVKKRTYKSDKSGEMVTVNNINDFLRLEEFGMQQSDKKDETFFNDDIPF